MKKGRTSAPYNNKGDFIMYKVISITKMGEAVNLDNLDIIHVSENAVLAKPKGYGNCFMQCYSKADCYTVITEKVEA